MSSDSLRFSPDILRRLGEELIPNVDQGIIELVRNAYDADAVECQVELHNVGQPGGTLRVLDDGVGMSESDIRSGWMVLGRSGKAGRQLTRKLGRLPVGDKGLGRLSALRLGSRAVLATRPVEEPGVEYEVEIEWARFDYADTVESVPLSIQKRQTDSPPGTTIEVHGLKICLDHRDVQRLVRCLLLLADPFDNPTGFHPVLVSDEFDELARRVTESYFDDADFKLTAQLSASGHSEAVVCDTNGRELFRVGDTDFGNAPYSTVTAVFELWAYILDKPTFSTKRSTHTEVQEWLREVGGVHLYHRGLRVHPYGDPGHDWLDMNLRRAQSPELRPSTNTSIGRVVVTDPEDVLIQKTDRTGFIENEAFRELKRFANDALEWMAKERLRARDAKRQKEHTTLPQAITEAKTAVEVAIRELPTESQDKLKSVVKQLEKARDREIRILREDVQLYRTLATVGTISAVFAHEAAQPARIIEDTANEVAYMAGDNAGLFDRDDLKGMAQIITRAVQSLRSFANIPMRLLKRDKRKPSEVDVHEVMVDALSLFQPFLDQARISLDLRLAERQKPVIQGSVTAIETIIANLLTNAAYVLMHAQPKPSDCCVMIQTTIGIDRMAVRVLDNGPGVQGLALDEIWLPGRTTKPGGTGLGLTIVKDVVTDLGGSVNVISPGELGGAEFAVELPLAGASS